MDKVDCIYIGTPGMTRHGGKRLHPGDTVSIPADQVKRYCAQNAFKPPDGFVPPGEEAPPVQEPAEKPVLKIKRKAKAKGKGR